MLVLGSVAALYHLLATDAVAVFSLYTAEFVLLILYITWVGLVRPLRGH